MAPKSKKTTGKGSNYYESIDTASAIGKVKKISKPATGGKDFGGTFGVAVKVPRVPTLAEEVKNQFLATIKIGEYANTMALTLGKNNGLFEMGGCDDQRGYAVIIANPGGGLMPPANTKILYNRYPNAQHATFKVWDGCLVGIGSQFRGSKTVNVYRLSDVPQLEDDADYNKKQTCTATLLSTQEIDSLGDSGKKLIAAINTKMATFHCTEPQYINWYIKLNTKERNACLQRLSFQVQLDDGLNGSDVKKELYSKTPEMFFTEVRQIADDMAEGRNRVQPIKFVWIWFAYYIGIMEKENGEEQNVLVMHARHVYNDEGSMHPFNIAKNLYYTYIPLPTEEDPKPEMYQQFLSQFDKDTQTFTFGCWAEQLTQALMNGDTRFTMVKYGKCTAKPVPFEMLEKIDEAFEAPKIVATPEEAEVGTSDVTADAVVNGEE